MTPAEIDLALDADDGKGSPRPPAGSVDLSGYPGGAAGYAAWWRGLSRAERVRHARES